jgi:hypothetical protein
MKKKPTDRRTSHKSLGQVALEGYYAQSTRSVYHEGLVWNWTEDNVRMRWERAARAVARAVKRREKA